MTYYSDEAFPGLSDEQWARLQAYGSAQEVESGALLFGVGEATHDLILVDSGEAEVVRAATARAAEAVVAGFGAGQFVGELGLLTGQVTYLSGRVSQPGQVHRISPVSFRRLMDEDPDLSDVILRALMARRRYLRAGEAAWSIEILGSEMSAGAFALRTYTARQQLPHTWVEIDTPAGAALARAVAGGDLPVVITPTAVLRHATPALLTGQLGLSYQPVAGPLLDLVIVGAGPAGLAAAVYDASEGLKTLLFDAAAAGGQAAASSRIENHLGFTSGISSAELTGRAAVLAQKFGARIASPSQAARLDTTHERLTALKHEGGTLDTYLANYGLPPGSRPAVDRHDRRPARRARERGAEMTRDSVLEARYVVKSFGATPALRGASVTVGRGEILAIMGPSGSGKSTLLHCLAGILVPDSGQFVFDGTRIDTMPENRRSALRRDKFGFVFQFGQLVPELTAEENVALPLLLAGARRREALRRAREWFGRLGIDGLEGHRSAEMSGGQAQRVALARGLVAGPEILFADEPTGSLDSLAGERVMHLLTAAARDQGTTVVLVTHDPRVAAYADREIIVHDGTVTTTPSAPAAPVGLALRENR